MKKEKKENQRQLKASLSVKTNKYPGFFFVQKIIIDSSLDPVCSLFNNRRIVVVVVVVESNLVSNQLGAILGFEFVVGAKLEIEFVGDHNSRFDLERSGFVVGMSLRFVVGIVV